MKFPRVLHIIKNRYFITLFGFLVWLIFIDHNNLVERHKMYKEHKKLLETKREYKQKIIETREAAKAMDNKEYIEKIAREKYMMKKRKKIFIL
jgi:cell division protein FtsB